MSYSAVRCGTFCNARIYSFRPEDCWISHQNISAVHLSCTSQLLCSSLAQIRFCCIFRSREEASGETVGKKRKRQELLDWMYWRKPKSCEVPMLVCLTNTSNNAEMPLHLTMLLFLVTDITTLNRTLYYGCWPEQQIQAILVWSSFTWSFALFFFSTSFFFCFIKF